LPIPAASFELLVLSLKYQAEQGLGLIQPSPDEPPEVDLALARHAIDLLGVLHQKTRGNLSSEEGRLLEDSLTELRFRFAQASAHQPGPVAVPRARAASAG
jgi:Domain of unknown function (DUF1844)